MMISVFRASGPAPALERDRARLPTAEARRRTAAGARHGVARASAPPTPARWTAMLGGKPRSKPRCLIGFWASSGLIVDFANSVIIGTQEYGRFYLKKGMLFGLHKRTFPKALDAIRQRVTLSLS